MAGPKRSRATPAVDLVGAADVDDAVADDRDGPRVRLQRIAVQMFAPVMTRSAAPRPPTRFPPV
jgi:hypothetical protein